jgi:hypothetical protein
MSTGDDPPLQAQRHRLANKVEWICGIELLIRPMIAGGA